MKFQIVTIIAVVWCLLNSDMVKCACPGTGSDTTIGSDTTTGSDTCNMTSASVFDSCPNGDSDCDQANGFICKHYTSTSQRLCICPDFLSDTPNVGMSCTVNGAPCGTGLTCASGGCYLLPGKACISNTKLNGNFGLCFNVCRSGFCL